jgi:hypothetical protein
MPLHAGAEVLLAAVVLICHSRHRIARCDETMRGQ